MILIKAEVAYVLAVMEALAAGKLPAEELTSNCPECQMELTRDDNDYHVVVFDDEEDPDSPVALVVACEGFWVVNPALVGIDVPNWQGRYVDG